MNPTDPRAIEPWLRKMRLMTISGTIQSLWSNSRSFLRDRSGASAVEFAFIVPLLLVMYLGTLELSQGIEANKKVSRSASMIGDLVSQEDTITKETLNDILVIGESILQPYYRSKPTITITGININASSVATIAWQRKITNGATTGSGASSTTVAVPTQMKTANTFLVKVETVLDYKPVLTWNSSTKNFGSGGTNYTSAFTAIPMAESYFFSPRQTKTITCSNC